MLLSHLPTDRPTPSHPLLYPSLPCALPLGLWQALRDAVWSRLQAFTDGLSGAQFGNPLVSRLLDLQAGLGTPLVRLRLRLRLVLASRTVRLVPRRAMWRR